MMLSEVLDKPSSWCRGLSSVNSSGKYVLPDSPKAVKWDLLGALFYCYPTDYTDRYAVLKTKMQEIYGSRFGSVADFNDDPSTSFDDVKYLIQVSGL